MDLVGLAIFIVVVVAVIAIVGWFVRSSGITIPQPFLIALYAVLAIVCILVVANLAGIGPRVWR